MFNKWPNYANYSKSAGVSTHYLCNNTCSILNSQVNFFGLCEQLKSAAVLFSVSEQISEAENNTNLNYSYDFLYLYLFDALVNYVTKAPSESQDRRCENYSDPADILSLSE